MSHIYAAANLTANIDGEACRGEEWILTCISQSAPQRWTLENENGVSAHKTYVSGERLETSTMGAYTFTLVSASSIIKSIATTTLTSSTRAECGDLQSFATAALRITGLIMPLSNYFSSSHIYTI